MSEHHDRPDDHRGSGEAPVDESIDDETPGDGPAGGDEKTEDRLEADNAVEEDQIRALDPDAPTG
ncbi:hypothetical protein HDC37_001673 [Microbacterium sp. AK009]|uniref:hypothetical protein n=1 Tax=Microbacterium sp. AK009 TaxID=2723068 RepID=UPI0015CEB4D2|nr:hypothetical protein [Microbacterium sp. AK009]NYF16848.1 hypothetical protein [Microbacterium sp. AK009]